MRLITSHFTGGESKESHQEAAMEQKPSSSLLLVGLLAVTMLCAGQGHALRLLSLNDANGGLEFSFGSKAATAGAETEPLDPSMGDDYENEISHVEFEPELGSAAPYAVAAAPVPVPAATTTVTVAAAAGPATEPVTVRAPNTAATAAGSRSMKWWLPPSTMPSFPLFPNPGGMPAIPGLPLPGMPFHPIGGWAAPAPPAPSQPAPPATEVASTNANDPHTSGGGVN